MLRTITATEYVMPLKEGGSLPAIVAGDDDGTYVLKFRGAGQGPRALVAELVSGEIARALALPVPEIVLAELDPRMAKTERDPEIQELLQMSAGLNLAIDYLPGSITFDPLVATPIGEICAGGDDAGSIGSLPQRARFHWLVAPRSTVIQTSEVHAGVHEDPKAALEGLFEKLVRPPKE